MKDELARTRTYVFVIALVFTGAFIATGKEAFLTMLNVATGALVMSVQQDKPRA